MVQGSADGSTPDPGSSQPAWLHHLQNKRRRATAASQISIASRSARGAPTGFASSQNPSRRRSEQSYCQSPDVRTCRWQTPCDYHTESFNHMETMRRPRELLAMANEDVNRNSVDSTHPTLDWLHHLQHKRRRLGKKTAQRTRFVATSTSAEVVANVSSLVDDAEPQASP